MNHPIRKTFNLRPRKFLVLQTVEMSLQSGPAATSKDLQTAASVHATANFMASKSQAKGEENSVAFDSNFGRTRNIKKL